MTSQMTRTPTAQMPTRHPINTLPRGRSNLSNGASVTALATASSATLVSNTTTEAVERKSWLVMGDTIAEAVRLSAWKNDSANFALTEFWEVCQSTPETSLFER